MKKKVLQVMMAVAVMVLMFSLTAFAGEGITDITEKRYEAAIAHLNEFYIKKNPEAALTVYQGSYKDKKTLEAAAKKITAGAKTDEEKAKKIYEWVGENISYDRFYSSLSIDVYNNRKSQCYGYANLTRDLLRFVGVPAVTVTGHRDDMLWFESEEQLYDLVDKKEVSGHAWNMVYLNGKWEVVDALWKDFKLDRKSIIEYTFVDEVETLLPYYEGVYLQYDDVMTYKDGKIICINKNGNVSDTVMGILHNNIDYRWPYAAYKYRKLDSNKKLTAEKIIGKSGIYVRYDVFQVIIPLAPIKTKPDGTIQSYHAFNYKNNTVYITSSGGAVFLDESVKDVDFAGGGNLKLRMGEKIKMYPMLESDKKKYGITYKYYSEDTTVVTVDKNGYIKTKGYGTTMVYVDMLDEEGTNIHTESVPVAVDDGKNVLVGGPSGYAKDTNRTFIDKNTVKLTWKAVNKENITEFVILKKDKNGNYNYVGKTKGCSFTLKNVEMSYLHEIYIKAVFKRNGGISSNYSHMMFHGKPEKVKGLDCEKISLNGNKASVTLYWWHIGDDSPFWRDRIFNYYQIYQLKNGKWMRVGKVNSDDYAQFTVKNLKPGKTYSFKVRAVGGGSNHEKKLSNVYGSFSKVIKVTVPENIGTVKNVKKSLSGTTLKLSWSKVREADKYMVYEYNAKKDEWIKVATVKGTTATLKKVSKNKTHQYKVRAYDKTEKSTGDILVRNGAFSKVVKVKVR